MTGMRTIGPAPRRLPRPTRLHAAAARAPAALRRFLRDTRAVAGIAAALLTVGTVAGAALIVDHVWLYDQRDVLKTAAEAASTAATLEFNRQLAANPTIDDADLVEKLEAVARSYVLTNLAHLPKEQRERLGQDGELTITFPVLDRAERMVQVQAEANLGGTLFSRYLPLLGHYAGPGSMQVKAGVDSDSKPVEVVLAIDTSTSMKANLEDTSYTDPHLTLPADQECTASSLARECSRMAIVQRAALHLVDTLQPDENNRVAVGLVPWHLHVRLDQPTADRWTQNQWARYPKRRHYEFPWLNCNPRQVATCTNPPAGAEEALPGTAPGTWQRCLDEDRMDPGASNTLAALPDVDQSVGELLAPPSQKPFAQGYFQAGFGVGYQCRDPRSSSFPSDLQFQSCYELPPGLAQIPEQYQHKIYRSTSQYSCRPGTSEVLPLSTDPDAIKQEIRTLSPVGGLTYSALGVLWGQRLLEPSWKTAWGGTGAHPVGPTDPDADKMRKAIVLLTDGEDSYCGVGNLGCDEVDGRLVGVPRDTACTEAKKKGTEIFVIAAMKPGSISGELGQDLRACSSASDAEYPAGTRRPGTNYVFLNNHDPADIGAAFAEIAAHLRTLRRTL